MRLRATNVEREVKDGADATASDKCRARFRATSRRTAPSNTGLSVVSDVSLTMYYSYTCGGVRHLSRDCVQGSKCYNCSSFVSKTITRSSHFEVLQLLRFCKSDHYVIVTLLICFQGHISKDCPQPHRRACYTCGSEG